MKIGRIYKIIAGQGNECYVGSTFDQLNNRFKGHKNTYKLGKNDCSVVELFNKYGVTNCKMILIKEYKVLDRRHLEVYETLWIKKLKAMNKCEPCGGLLSKQRAKQYYEKQKQEKQEMKSREEEKQRQKRIKEVTPRGFSVWKKIRCEKCNTAVFEHNWKRHELSKIHS